MTTLPQSGEVFAGRYQVESTLGEGGFAIVFRATDQGRRTVALKILKPDGANGYSAATRGRYDREVAILAGLQDPHTITLHDFGESPGGLLFMAFEYLPGIDLSDLLHQRGRLTPAEVVHILRQLLSSLREAHAAGLIHRDLKPANVRVFERSGDPLAVKLLDFGIARGTDNSHPSVTKTGELVGTPRYMSPEQLIDQPLTPTSDLYSLGMMAFEMVMGSTSLQGSSLVDQISRLREDYVFRVEEVPADEAFVRLIEKMTARRPEDRYQSAAAVLNVLDMIQRGPTSGGNTPSIDRSRPSTTASHTSPAQRPYLIVGGLLATAIVAALVVVAVLASREQDLSAPPKDLSTTALRAIEPAPAVILPPKNDADADTNSAAEVVAVATGGCGVDYSSRMLNLEGVATFLPEDYDPSRKYPLVIAVHGDFVKPVTWLVESGLLDGGSEPFITVAPDDFKPPFGYYAWHDPMDAEKLRRAFESTVRNTCVDEERVFVAAHGTAGRAAFVVACEPWVKGTAIFAFGLPRGADVSYACDIPKPLLWVHPMNSKRIPAKANQEVCNRLELLGADESESLLRDGNKCRGAAKRTTKKRGTICKTWSCEAPFEMCRANGGGRWPGTHPPDADNLQPECSSNKPAEFPLAQKMLNFFGLADEVR